MKPVKKLVQCDCGYCKHAPFPELGLCVVMVNDLFHHSTIRKIKRQVDNKVHIDHLQSLVFAVEDLNEISG